MRKFLFFMLFLCLATAQAQELSKPRLDWSLQFSSAFTYTDQYTPLFYWQFCEEGCYPTRQQGTLASNLRIMVQRQLNARLRLGIGVVYAQKKLQESGMASNGSSTYYPTENTLTLHTVGIPATIQYDFLQRKRFSLFVESGVVTTFPIESRHVLRDRFKSTTYDLLIHAGSRITLNSTTQLLIGPSFITALSSYSQPTNLTFLPNNAYKPYSIGLEASLQIRL